jgi:undecaprenyl pyrophosphate phosphatase UppP
VVAAVVGVLALKVVLGLLRAARFHHFAWYCWALGALTLAALASR